MIIFYTVWKKILVLCNRLQYRIITNQIIYEKKLFTMYCPDALCIHSSGANYKFRHL